MDEVVGVTSDVIDDVSRDDVTPLSKLLAVLMTLCIVATIFGNILVVLSVFTYRPLRAVQNFYIVSLAVADLAVAVLVMPFNAAVSTANGRWYFGSAWCHIWLTCDILTCTASILNLCAIAVDRYFAVHNPIDYGRSRTVRKVLVAVALVWIASAIISIPPLILFGRTGTGNETSDQNNATSSYSILYDDARLTCELSDQPVYVIYSASGSFFIPLVIMIFVYVNIYAATRARLRARAAADGRLAAIVTTTSASPIPAETARLTTGTSLFVKNNAHKPETDRYNTERVEAMITRNVDNVEVGGVAEGVVTSFNGTPEGKSLIVPTTAMHHSGRGTNQNTPPVVGDVVVVGEQRRGPFLARSTRRFRSILRRFNVDDDDIECDIDEIDGADSPRFDLRRRRQQSSSSSSPTSKNGSGRCGNSSGQRISQFLEEKQRISLARERRAARTMGIVMGAFVLCWLPFFVVYVVFAFHKPLKESTDMLVYNFIVWLGYVNSTLNPLIYTVFNVDFRRAFALLIRCRCNRRRRHVK